MYCPRCGAVNEGQTNFCRSCGADLKAIVMVLSGQLTIHEGSSEAAELAREQRELRSFGLHRAIQGAVMSVMGLLLAIPLNIFSSNADWHNNWIIIWLVVCGWLPVLGAVWVGTGISSMIQSRLLRGQIDRLAADPLPPAASLPKTTEAQAPLSVSEHTTEKLVKPTHL